MDGRILMLDGGVCAFSGSFTRELDTDARRWDLEGRHSQDVGEGGKLVDRNGYRFMPDYEPDVKQCLNYPVKRGRESFRLKASTYFWML